MESEEIEEKVKGWLSKGARVSKKAIETVGDKVQDFTDKRVIKLEKKQLEGLLDSKYIELGKKISSLLENSEKNEGHTESEEHENCSCESEKSSKKYLDVGSEENLNHIRKLQSDIQTLISKIAEKEKEID